MAVSRLLDDHDDEATTDALNKLYGEHPELAKVDPVLDQLQLSALPEDDW